MTDINYPPQLRLSIIIPAYNAGRYIERCISSLIDQSFDSYEIIVVNDGSTDDTPILLEQIANSNKNISGKLKIISQENSGVSIARNSGIVHSKGEYLMFVDADDTIESDCLAEVFHYVDQSDCPPDYVIFGMKSVAINGSTSIIAEFPYRNYPNPRELFESIMTNSLAFGGPWGKLYRKTVLSDNGIFFSAKYARHEDAIFNCQFAPYCRKAISIPTMVYSYLHNTGGATLKFFGEDLIPMNNAVRQSLIGYFVVHCNNPEALKPINRRSAYDYLFSIYSLYRRKGVKNKRYWTKRYWAAATDNDKNWSYEFDSGIPRLVGMVGRHSLTGVDMLLRFIFGTERFMLALKNLYAK